MLKIHHKYFWDGMVNISGPYKLQRIIEYASFPDLIKYPFEELINNIQKIQIDRVRTSQTRKEFIKFILPYVSNSTSWEEAIKKAFNKSLYDYLL